MTGRWIDVTKPKRPPRKEPKRRFENIKVGDQLMREWIQQGWRGGRDDTKQPPVKLSSQTWYYIVTDLWFDPVKGDEKPRLGEMVAIQRLGQKGEPIGRKIGHSKTGLASNAYRYADMDYVKFCNDRLAAIEEGRVVGIGMGQIIRRRPKVSGGGL